MEKGRRGQLMTVWIWGLLLVLSAADAWAEGEMTARFLADQGVEIVLEVQVAAPAPGSLIVLQRVPKDSVLKAAVPSPKKSAQGEIKWLIRRPQVGILTLRTTFEAPLPQGTVSALILCKDPKTGEMLTVKVP